MTGVRARAHTAAIEPPASAHYRPAGSRSKECGTCGALNGAICTMFNVPVSSGYVCDKWYAAKPRPANAGVAHHNRVLRAGRKRAETLEPHLADLLGPVLDRAADKAAREFARLANDHLTASLPPVWPYALASSLARLHQDGVLPALTAAIDVQSNSTMVCVRPRPEEAAALADPDGDPAENLHVTLCYLGEIDGDLQPIADALRPVAALHAPLKGVVAGYGQFGTDDGPVGILLPDVPGLVELRVEVTEALSNAGVTYSRTHGFLAHVTVDGDPEPDEADTMLDRNGLPLTFDALLIVRGNTEVIEVPLVGIPPLTAAGVSEQDVADARDALHAAEDKLRKALDSGSQPRIKIAKNELAEARRALQRVATAPQWTSPAADEMIDTKALMESLRGVTDPVRQAAVKSTMTPSLAAVGVAFDPANPFTAKVLAASAAKVTQIGDTTRANLMRVIRDSYDAGLSIPDTAAAIRLGMKAATIDRATTIARSELVSAVNGGALAAMNIVSDVLGESYSKVWITAPGAPFPRHETYDGLDGQEVGLAETFDVGGDDLMYPGDPDGSPEETINCRCALSWAGQEVEAEGE